MDMCTALVVITTKIQHLMRHITALRHFFNLAVLSAFFSAKKQIPRTVVYPPEMLNLKCLNIVNYKNKAVNH